MARQARGVIATNRPDYQALQAFGLPPDRLCQIPIGSNINPLPPDPEAVAAVRASLGLPAESFLLGYFGFLNPSKGADALLAALASLEDHYHLVLIGGLTGDSDRATNSGFLAELEARIAALGLGVRVHRTGYLDSREVSDYLNAADLLVMPYRDGATLRRGSLMAALAHGRPLLTTVPAEPTDELVHGENVWLSAVDDPAALAEAIQALATNPSLRQTIGAGAARLAARFQWGPIARQTAAFYASLFALRP
jgi:glycosyltransferase involved in cell wall biosynthesis